MSTCTICILSTYTFYVGYITLRADTIQGVSRVTTDARPPAAFQRAARAPGAGARRSMRPRGQSFAAGRVAC